MSAGYSLSESQNILVQYALSPHLLWKLGNFSIFNIETILLL